ncbi:unnamed protein product [Oikopleura dioica]|uniref:Uncharacterized protein n=1 Tax=Oikopleura dioica TaxID=34765 RepID=E4WRT6_OIKDI|nr:unnamed protein product [Oikopleura dioica]CBY32994.1 unnamed protein product [Oikopleura dioica]
MVYGQYPSLTSHQIPAVFLFLSLAFLVIDWSGYIKAKYGSCSSKTTMMRNPTMLPKSRRSRWETMC